MEVLDLVTATIHVYSSILITEFNRELFHLDEMQRSEKNLGWEDLIFVPPGKSFSQHIQEVIKA